MYLQKPIKVYFLTYTVATAMSYFVTDQSKIHYITCYLLDAFIQSDLHTQYCGQSPQEQCGVTCLAQGHNDMLTAVGFEPVLP